MGMEVGVVELVRTGWIAGTLPILIASLPLSCLNSFHDIVLGFAKRGKILQSSSSKVRLSVCKSHHDRQDSFVKLASLSLVRLGFSKMKSRFCLRCTKQNLFLFCRGTFCFVLVLVCLLLIMNFLLYYLPLLIALSYVSL